VGPTKSRRMHSACQRRVRGSTHSPRGLVPPWRSAGSTASSTALCRFPMWPDPAAIRSIRALCVATEHTAGRGRRLKLPCFHPAKEPTTAQSISTPAIGPATAACRGRPPAGCA
jgi:hypothetical protein